MKQRKLLPLASIIGLIVAVMLLASPDSAGATTFTPEQPNGVVFSAVAPGANPDITISFDMVQPSTYVSNQVGQLVTFGDGAVATAGDAAVPTGAYIGSLSAVWNLGLASAECNAAVPITFNLVEAATPATTPAVIAPAGPPTNLLANLAVDADGNGIADGADAYPTFLAAALDPDAGGPAAPIAPLARYFGVSFVAASLISVVQVVVMPQGALAAMPNMGWMTNPWGYPMLVFFDNSLAPPSNSAISDSCNFTSTLSLLGIGADNACTPAAGSPPACTGAGAGFVLKFAVSGGCPGGAAPNECGPVAPLVCPCARVANPPAPAVVTWRQYVASQRDWDTAAPSPALGDGFTNDLDPCPATVDPAVPPDADFDGIWNSCDPGPPGCCDQDADGWGNRLDNCPLVANAPQVDGDVPLGVSVPDGGPRQDGIGAACDPAPGAPNGHYHATALAYHICIGPPVPACAAGLDADGDGVANIDDNCIARANAPITFPGPSGTTTLSLGEPAGSAVLDVASTAGFTVGSPIVVGGPLETLRYIIAIDPPPAPITLTISAPLAALHPAGAPVAQVMFSQSQRDLNVDGFIDISEVAVLASGFGTTSGTPGAIPGFQGRADLNYDNFIDISDMAIVAAIFGLSC